ncbi:hypothetical protein, partial [Streptomyces sp. NPDC048845]|uniref:hypothetical protein n=1 Tax=Streptomyces sp. NPDC048845 TaxID=3155390 RepID=UPI00341AD5BE
TATAAAFVAARPATVVSGAAPQPWCQRPPAAATISSIVVCSKARSMPPMVANVASFSPAHAW